MRAFIIALCVFLWLILGWFLYSGNQECCTDGDTSSTEETTSGIIQDDKSDEGTTNVAPAADDRMSDYLMFNYSKDDPILRDDWDTRKSQIVSGLGDDQFLEITGQYRSGEVNNTTFENLGLARANKVKDLISPPINSDRIILKSKLVDDGVDSTGLFTSINFRNFTKTATIDESIEDKTIIRFPFNSTNKLNDSAVENYLDKVAERIKKSGERVRLTGHTDSVGGEAPNMRLGMWRAEVIKNYLVAQGVSGDKVITLSKGENSPIATNSTSAGRAENRRTELEIIK